jgi:pimeloyl-ACP methyl ester carboxylesterase
MHIESSGAGVPVVLIHGAFCDCRHWTPQLETLAPRYRAIAPSLPGFWPDMDAARAAAINSEHHVADIEALLADLGEPAHLVGHSRGGRLALHVAARTPEHVRSLVLMEPAGAVAADLMPPPSDEARQRGKVVEAEAWRRVEAGDAEGGMRLWIDFRHQPGAWDHAPPLARTMGLANTGTMPGMMDDASAPMTRAAAAMVKAPTLLIDAAGSPPRFRAIAAAVEAAIPGCRRVTLPGGDHFMNLSAREAFDSALLAFLESAG